MKENANRFILAYNSSLLQSDLVHQLGHSSEGEPIQQILQNRVSLAYLDPRLQDVMNLFTESVHDHALMFIPCTMERPLASLQRKVFLLFLQIAS